MSRRMRLSVLADGLFAVPADADRDIHGLCADSRAVAEGEAFLAVPGLSAHGLSYLSPAQAAKAAVVMRSASGCSSIEAKVCRIWMRRSPGRGRLRPAPEAASLAVSSVAAAAVGNGLAG